MVGFGAEKGGSGAGSVARLLLGGDDLVNVGRVDLANVGAAALGDVGGVACTTLVVSDGKWLEILLGGEVVVAEDVAQGVGGGDG